MQGWNEKLCYATVLPWDWTFYFALVTPSDDNPATCILLTIKNKHILGYELIFHALYKLCRCQNIIAKNSIVQWTFSVEMTRWRRQIETLSALLTFCAGNSPVNKDPPRDLYFSRCCEQYRVITELSSINLKFERTSKQYHCSGPIY